MSTTLERVSTKELKTKTIFPDKSETRQIEKLLDTIFECYNTASVEKIISSIKLYADELPRSVREQIYEFRETESSLVLNISHSTFSDFQIGKTPDRYPMPDNKRRCSRAEIYHMLISSCLGQIFTWNSIQNGNIINEIIPIKENADKPISSGTNFLFDLHTEDAFHPFAGEYLSLFCMRNPHRTATILSYIPPGELTDTLKKVLFQPRFYVGANIAHDLQQSEKAYSPILFGDYDSPYFRINLNKMEVRSGDTEAQSALNHARNILRKNTFRFEYNPGDVLFIDNLRVAHGREVYKANYDGNDRWLKRLYITLDLKKSRSIRHGVNSRILQTR